MNESTHLQMIQGQDYERQYFPFGGFLLIRKDEKPKQEGSIIIPDQTHEKEGKHTTTGVIIAKSLFTAFEDDYEKYVLSVVRRGDRVGFISTTPLWSPSPPFYKFDSSERELYITIHAKDIICIICETEEKRVDFAERF